MAGDIGWFNIGAYHHGIMGVSKTNIDRVCNEGAIFTDASGEASCTAEKA
jgi:arylsulfatase A-like enzyme